MDGSVTTLPDGRVIHHDGGPRPGTDACVPTFEICGDGIDQNCDGRETSCGNTDRDFFPACRPGEAPPDCDCDDANSTVYPGAPETCNGIDDDCDGRVDEIAACCAACTGMVERADTCTTAGACVCSTEGAGDAPCPAGQTCCLAGCVDTQTDFQNCGGCQSACPCGSDRCTAGSCTCGTSAPCMFVNECIGGACAASTCSP